MKIEKVNEHQIRCTLTREDLASRKLKLSELAYGSEKAKDLFRDMMEKANDEYGFDADNIPLMIEAIPINSECIVLIITKVEDPEELDTRFSKFAPGVTEGDEGEEDEETIADSEESGTSSVNIAELFKKFKDAAGEAAKNGKKAAEGFEGMAFVFNSITELSKICKSASSFFHGTSSLYNDIDSKVYLLTINRGGMDIEDFVQSCNLFAEYGSPQKGRQISEAYLREHFEPICQGNAIETLAEIG